MKTILLLLGLAASCSAADVYIQAVPARTAITTLTNCQITYSERVQYVKTVSQGWGWKPSTNTTLHTITDTNSGATRIEYIGKFGDSGCGFGTVTLSTSPFSPAYRFGVYFPTNGTVPTNQPYWLKLSGFDP